MKDLLEELTKQEFDIIVAITRGGMIPACLMAQLLNIRDIDALNVEYYAGASKTLEQPFIFPKRYDHINSRKVLVVDDLTESGKTLNYALDYLKQFRPSDLKVFTVFKKKSSLFNPDYFLKEIPDEWVNFDYQKVYDFEPFFKYMQYVPATTEPTASTDRPAKTGLLEL
ncbi:MAG: phosphoribosyltransferase family protein [bacterium]